MNDLDVPADDVDGTVEPDDADAAVAADPDGTDETVGGDDADPEQRDNPAGTIAIAVLLGIGLLATARSGFVPLLIAVAFCQALLAFSYVFGTSMPGRKGAVVLAVLAGGGADAAVAIWPDSGMSAVLPVLALLLPAMFVHQLLRGAARNRVVESMGAVALLQVCVIGFAALLSLSRQFTTVSRGGQVAGGLAAVIAGAIVVANLTDLVINRPRFDPDVRRGIPGVLLAAVVGGLIGVKALGGGTEFVDGRGMFVGAAVGALVALFAVAAGFVERSTTLPGPGFGRRVRPVLGAVFPMALGSPIALLICLAIRA